MENRHSKLIGIVGLGYVGLPLAVAFSKVRPIVGFDVNDERVRELKAGFDRTGEVSREELNQANFVSLSASTSDLEHVDIYIITVPTPIDKYNKPDLSFIEAACKLIGSYLSKGNIVILESTVYPGATEEICVPILEKVSELTFNIDFFCGYSPERINPGDKLHKLENIKKITSGSTKDIAKEIDKLYREIIIAGTHLAPNIKTAEAAKVIENTQRDINIALINELAQIFSLMEIDTLEVLEAASTKWNFLNFRPGLVGGHCIGVDPYYLTYKAESLGYIPHLVLAGRQINDKMASFAAEKFIKLMVRKNISPIGAKVLILGITFKENCPDTRNTKVVDLCRSISEFGCAVEVFDPIASVDDFLSTNISFITEIQKNVYDGVIIAVPHKEILEMGIKNISLHLKSDRGIVFDLKGAFHKLESDIRL